MWVGGGGGAPWWADVKRVGRGRRQAEGGSCESGSGRSRWQLAGEKLRTCKVAGPIRVGACLPLEVIQLYGKSTGRASWDGVADGRGSRRAHDVLELFE